MLTSLGVAGLLGIIGTFAAVLWTAVLGVGGTPDAALARLGTRYDKGALINAGTFVSFVIESYLLLAFAGLVIRLVEGFLSTRPTAPAWPLWLVGWYLGAGRHGHRVRICPAGGGGRVLGVCPVAAGARAGVGMAAGDSALV
jgi:hypothetical protein